MIFALDLFSFDILAFFDKITDPTVTPTINAVPTIINAFEYSEYSHIVNNMILSI